ncbi:MAG TPA: recombinase family protein [Micropepsaceae bacterium]|jgi:DNA invertase Pin-like site-specific DNA recombinase
MQAQSSKFVAYLRVSTAKQGRSGLGLEAQREAVRQFVVGRGGKIIAPEFVEVETGKDDARPELDKALKRCRITGATLVIAKLDRLSRNVAFLMRLRDEGAKFVAADLPDANTLTLGVMASMAQHEREVISRRTKDALAAAKARGTVLGGYRENAPDIARFQRKGAQAARKAADVAAERYRETIDAMQAENLSLNAMAARMNETGIMTRTGKQWTATAVRNLVARL